MQNQPKMHPKQLQQSFDTMPAMSLIEMSFVLIIIGVLMGLSLQGWKYVENARNYALSQKILQIKTASESLIIDTSNTQYLHNLALQSGLSYTDSDGIKLSNTAFITTVSDSKHKLAITGLNHKQIEKICQLLGVQTSTSSDLSYEQNTWLSIDKTQTDDTHADRLILSI